MVFSSPVFLCLFLPSVLAVNYICPVSLRNVWLFVASLFFYAWGEPVYIALISASILFNYWGGRMLGRSITAEKKKALRKFLPAFLLAVNTAVLLFFKYADFIIGTFNQVADSELPLLGLALPIGISFYTFQVMSYLIDVYRGQVKAQSNFIAFGMYVSLFPQLVAGPVIRYGQIEAELKNRAVTMEQCAAGMQRFLLGLAKKILLANSAGALWDGISRLDQGDMSAALAWLGAVAFTFQLYFDFSGYSDMAVGIGQMLGFHFPENFRYPYESKSITEFWRRWHMTLGGWFREYIYIPLGGSRRGLPRQVMNLFVVWLLTGLWHGASWNFVLWGMYYFVLLMIEKFFCHIRRKRPETAGREAGEKHCALHILGHIYTLFFVIVGTTVFACTDIGKLAEYLKMMFGAGVPAGNALAAYEWSSNAVLLVVLAAASVSIFKKMGVFFSGKLEEKGRPGVVFTVKSVWCGFLYVLSIAMLVNGSYNPFLYFRF